MLKGFTIKKILRRLGYAVFLVLSVWALLELAFRYQWIDFYADELRGLNPPEALDGKGHSKTMLFFGDSFSAQPHSYVDVLRDSLPDAALVNAAAPGTGILEAGVMAPRRLERFPPDVLVCQVYVGNDLWDLRKTCNSPQISTLRNLYWRLSDWSLVLRFFNYKLGQFKNRIGAATEAQELKQDIPFSPEQYSRREKLMFRAEPDLIQNSVMLRGKRAADMQIWLHKMDELLSRVPERAQKILILVVPHCAQVNAFYAGNLTRAGATPFPAEMQERDYPFLKLIREHFSLDARVRVASPLPLFQQSDSTGHRLYYENDPHLTTAGQELLAGFVLETLNN